MSKFGWSLPPGCGTLPGEESGALELKVPGLPRHLSVYWTEDDEILVMSYLDCDERLLAKYTYVWNDAVDDEQNIAAATEFAKCQMTGILSQQSGPTSSNP